MKADAWLAAVTAVLCSAVCGPSSGGGGACGRPPSCGRAAEEERGLGGAAAGAEAAAEGAADAAARVPEELRSAEDTGEPRAAAHLSVREDT